ncbi:MAG: hypothetical protein ACKPCP_34200 [Sphaerospermopsis kisseleviana]
MGNKEPQGYPERWVRAACVQLYQAPIAPRTWDAWKSICNFPDFRCKGNRENGENIVSKTHCLWVLCLACMKREQAEKTKGGKPRGVGSKITLPQIVKMLNSPIPLPNGKTRKQSLEEALGDAILIEGLPGRDVPLWLQKHTGWKPSISTIRRRAKELNLEFSLSSPVPRKTLDTLLNLAYAA